jgi:hypothetical protein
MKRILQLRLIWCALLAAVSVWANANATHGCAQTTGNSAVTSRACTYTVTAGHALEILGLTNTSTPTFTTSGGETFTVCPTPTFAFTSTTLTAVYTCWYILSATGGSETFTLTFTSNTFSGIFVEDMTGLAASSPFDTGAHGSNATGTGGTDVTTANLTAAAANELLLAWGNQGAPGGMTATSGWTALFADTNTGFGLAWKLAGAAGTYNGSMHLPSSVGWDVFVSAWKPAASAAVPKMTLLGVGP